MVRPFYCGFQYITIPRQRPGELSPVLAYVKGKSALDNAAAPGWFFFAAGGKNRREEVKVGRNMSPAWPGQPLGATAQL
jgi:hypothetical protein